MRGEAPFASHLLYTQNGVLNDQNAQERLIGIRVGLEWASGADATVVYIDRGMSEGMRLGIAEANRVGRPVEIRSIEKARPVSEAGQHRLTY